MREVASMRERLDAVERDRSDQVCSVLSGVCAIVGVLSL